MNAERKLFPRAFSRISIGGRSTRSSVSEGDGTNTIANKISKVWPNVIGVPKTIDNDLLCTDQTFGFDTACSFVTESLDRIHSTAQSHHRVMVIEVMGRYAGGSPWLAVLQVAEMLS